MNRARNYEGYDTKIFLKKVNLDLICTICSCVVRKPRECTICGSLNCEDCLKLWIEKNSYQNISSECPLKCKKTSDLHESIMKPVGKVIKNILYALEVKCPNKDCEQIMTLDKYEDHEYYCQLPKCQNNLCSIPCERLIISTLDDSTELKTCSEICKYSLIFQRMIQTESKEDMCNWFHNFIKNMSNNCLHKECEKRICNLKNMVRAVSGNNLMPINDLEYSPGITFFKWDPTKKGQGIQIYNNGESLILNESCYAFRSILSNQPFTSGVHYWEIIADKRTENELKIGITKNINFNYDTSFSDYNFGWAFYGIGQLRHSNNATGESFGKKFKKSGVLGVFFDMNRGILSFALDGDYFGIAFQSEELKTGPVWAAISLLHVGGCSLQTGIPAPPYFFSDY